MQAAGERLSSVGKLLQNPLSDPSSAAKEISDRLQRKFSPTPLEGVHSSLRGPAELLQKRTADFGDAVEFLLRKHGKKIVDEQMQLERIADSAIALFAMTATISRATSSLNAGIESAEHEKKLTTLHCVDQDPDAAGRHQDRRKARRAAARDRQRGAQGREVHSQPRHGHRLLG